jgi:hypothetical protein
MGENTISCGHSLTTTGRQRHVITGCLARPVTVLLLYSSTHEVNKHITVPGARQIDSRFPLPHNIHRP